MGRGKSCVWNGRERRDAMCGERRRFAPSTVMVNAVFAFVSE